MWRSEKKFADNADQSGTYLLEMWPRWIYKLSRSRFHNSRSVMATFVISGRFRCEMHLD